jgi:hypothetical protein
MSRGGLVSKSYMNTGKKKINNMFVSALNIIFKKLNGLRILL